LATSDIEQQILARKWFYRFVLPGGAVTDTYLADQVLPIHDTREQMLFSVLDPLFDGRWDGVTCLDLPCHQGYYSLKLGARGCRQVLGVDARAQHVDDARLMQRAFDAENVEFRVGNIHDADLADLGPFDVFLLFGLLYHLENPIGALRQARRLTRRVCLIETQVTPDLSRDIDWGVAGVQKSLRGYWGVVDETHEVASGNMEANLTAISLVPSPEALRWTLLSVGFSRVEFVPPPAGAYEQLASGKRLVAAAYVD
jgi:SAM-dependent methyltransferase